MDTDWCLSCGHHVASDAPYCSPVCLSRARDRPSVPTPPFNSNLSSLHTLSDTDSDADAVFHDIQDAHWGSDHKGILAWAANIPPGSSEGTLSSGSSRVPSRPTSPPARRTPKLLLSNRRPAAASLCMSTPHPEFLPPSRPIVAPSPSVASLKLATSAGDLGGSMSSLFSGITDSVVATPSSAGVRDHIYSEQDPKCNMPQMLDALAIHVRSWASPLPQPQPKSEPLVRAAKPPGFTLKSHMALHGDLDESDDYLPHDAWWVSEEREKDCRVSTSEITRPRGPHRECDHSAYRARGRKVSRAFS